MNKMFTAVATLQLVEAGKLALDDPIGKHLPDYPNKEVAAKVTVRHLLTHTGGTGDIFGPEFESIAWSCASTGLREALRTARARLRAGQRFEYSNYGFVLLGRSSKRSAASPTTTTCASNVFQPAGMTSTGLAARNRDVPNRPSDT